jgi:hypothetical protein
MVGIVAALVLPLLRQGSGIVRDTAAPGLRDRRPVRRRARQRFSSPTVWLKTFAHRRRRRWASHAQPSRRVFIAASAIARVPSAGVAWKAP